MDVGSAAISVCGLENNGIIADVEIEGYEPL